MSKKHSLVHIVEEWFDQLPRYKTRGNYQALGTIAGALVVLEHLREEYNLDIDWHMAESGTQIRGAGRRAFKQILKQHGEERPLLEEGGRTNRGARKSIAQLLEALKPLRLGRLSEEERRAILFQMQAFLVDRVREYHTRQRLSIAYDPAKSTHQTVQDLLEAARAEGKEGAVAQYLIGAKLTLRFEEFEISNESFSTADQQSNRQGDFCLGHTIFHVTVAPMTGHYEKCKRNLAAGLRVYLLVPERIVHGVRQMANAEAEGQIAVESIESFVSQNIDELANFSRELLPDEFCRLLETYNHRVDAVEADKSMLIDIPENLLRQQIEME